MSPGISKASFRSAVGDRLGFRCPEQLGLVGVKEVRQIEEANEHGCFYGLSNGHRHQSGVFFLFLL